MHKFTILLFVLTILRSHCEAKIFTRCELVAELKKQGFPAKQLRNWICLIEAESSSNTGIVGPEKLDGSRNWGLFQINDKNWCSTSGKPGKKCNVRCLDLVKEDITRACKCARLIYKRYKFKYWPAWVYKCKGKPLPDISQCVVDS